MYHHNRVAAFVAAASLSIIAVSIQAGSALAQTRTFPADTDCSKLTGADVVACQNYMANQPKDANVGSGTATPGDETGNATSPATTNGASTNNGNNAAGANGGANNNAGNGGAGGTGVGNGSGAAGTGVGGNSGGVGGTGVGGN